MTNKPEDSDAVNQAPKVGFETRERIDEILSALGDTHRRHVLFYLQDESPASRTDVARKLAVWEYGTPSDEISDKTIQEIETQLVHTHLPRLEEAKLVEYDSRSGQLVVRDLPEFAKQCLDYCESVELSS